MFKIITFLIKNRVHPVGHLLTCRKHLRTVDRIIWLVNLASLWCLTPLSTIFQLYRGGQFYWWRKVTVASHWLTLSHNVVSSTHPLTLGDVWCHNASLVPPLVIEVSIMQIQESERSCICVRGIDFVSTIYLLDFGTVSTEWYFFIFSLYYIILHIVCG